MSDLQHMPGISSILRDERDTPTRIEGESCVWCCCLRGATRSRRAHCAALARPAAAFPPCMPKAGKAAGGSVAPYTKPVKKHACPQCPLAFARSNNLASHIRAVHEKRKDHICPQCAAAFGRTSHLSKHIRTVHEKRKDHTCTQCAAAFGEAGSLAKHVRTVHEKRKDHHCKLCSAAFGEAGDLSKHVRTVHEKRRDYACPRCTSAFGRAGDLARHVRTMHEKRSDDFACPHCDSAFSDAGMRVRHVLAKHPDEASGDCLLCFEPLDGVSPKAVTRCNHRFCRTCIEEELRRSGKCPMCRTSCSAAGLKN